MSDEIKLTEIISNRGCYKDIHFKISSWYFDSPALGFERAWNYYIYIPEKNLTSEMFDKCWLPDKLVKYSPESEGWISHDYYDSPLGDVPIHGGITYYAKLGHTEGKRVIEIGCDYQHLNDRNQTYWVEMILVEVKETIDWLWANLLIDKKPKMLVENSEKIIP
jgi:hypothetical protein